VTAALPGQPQEPDPDLPAPRNLLVGVSGSSNVLNLPAYVFALRRIGPDVRITAVLTRTAALLLPPRTAGLICDEVYCDGDADVTVSHVRLAARADQVIVLPATANMLGQAAHGLASGLLSSVLLASPQPVIFVPCMNKVMWEQPSIRRNVATLRADGHDVVDPEPGAAWIVGTRELQTAAGLPQPAAVAARVQFRFASRVANPG
jgi:phosphopantothenoylcysteine synthetase/decarboxylase